MIAAGIDIGSVTAKAAIVSERGILGVHVIPTGYNPELAGEKVLEGVLRESGTDRAAVGKIVSTGYGRNSVRFADKAMTEIICHAAGAHFLNPEVRSVIDIGGQDSKVIIIDPNGKVKDFVMNDKCAAGTGRFLEVMARALELDLDGLGAMSEKAEKTSKISSICTVFAESEVISLISRGEKRENIIAGIHESVASRVFALAKRIGAGPPTMMTGGVAKNKGVRIALEQKLGTTISVNEHAQTNGAIGAAVLALRMGG